MPTTTAPLVENWYKDLETDRTFRVVAIEEETDSIEIQYYNGDIDELDFPSWYESSLASIEPPEDWSAPFDDVEIDDLGYSDPDLHGPDQENITLSDLLDESEV